MKNYLKISLLSLTATGLVTSCDMDAPTQSSLDESSVYSIYSMAETGVMSICESLCETNAFRGRFMPYYGLNTDVEVKSNSVPSYSDRLNQDQNLANYATDPTNTRMNINNDCYSMFYEAIERANIAIRGLRTYGDIENNPDMAQLLGEAITLRAMVYFDLIKMHGDVPARFEPITNETMYMPRADKDSIFKVLLADLAEAEEYCYWPNDGTMTRTTERVSKAFVKGLRARIALSAGGYNLRGNGYRLSNDPELAPELMYQIARDECVSIINQGCNHLIDYETIFRNYCQDIVTAGQESIYEIPFSAGRGRVVYTWGVDHREADQYTGQNQGGDNGPAPYLFYDYDVDDVRRDITCVPYQWDTNPDGTQGSQGGVDYTTSYQDLRSIDKWCFGKYRYEWMNRYVTSTNDDGVNWPVMRYADIYLMAAEAINELSGPSEAAPYMREILNRAFPTHPEKVTALLSQYTASQQAFREGIYDQRALEFAGEALRKQDLIRWGNIDTKMAEAKTKLNQLRNRQGAYSDLPERLYYKYDTDGESLLIYGLNHGDTDDEGQRLRNEEGYTSTSWFVDSETNEPIITDDYINGLYLDDHQPSLNCLWPIWQMVIDRSNGLINNDGNYGQL